MAHVRDSDTSLWLHNKLGTSNDLWTGGSICSQLNQDVLRNIRDCFIDLQSQVKLKLLLAFLHIPRRNVEEWRTELEEVIEVASADNDQWVSMLAELLKAFPSTGNLNFQIEENAKVFTDLTNDVRKIVKKYCEQAILPLECLYLNRNSFTSVVGHLPQPAKHFALKRKPKSAALRAELLQKSSDAALSLKKNTSTPTVPIRCRGISKSISDAGSFRGLGAKNSLGGSVFRSQPTNSRLGQNSNNRSVSGNLGRPNPAKKDGGIKLLDITEQPQGYSRDAKRRKKLPENEVPEVKKEGVPVVPGTTPTQTATPDYAAGLLSSTQLSNPSGSVTSSTVGVDYLTTSNISGISGQTTPTGQAQIVSFQSPSSASLESTSSNSPTTNVTSTGGVIISNPNATILSPSNASHTAKTIGNLAAMGGATVQVSGTQPQQLVSQAQGQPNAQSAPVTVVKKGLQLSRDQMMEAQEMFKNSNKVTRPEKALILGFMAGSRDNPCPPLGNIVTIKLSENKEEIIHNGVAQLATVETHFQMNYKTGEWKRVKKVIKAEA